MSDRNLDAWVNRRDTSLMRAPARDLIESVKAYETDNWHAITPPDEQGRVWYIDVKSIPADAAAMRGKLPT